MITWLDRNSNDRWRVTLCLNIENNLTWEHENQKQAWSPVECKESGILLNEEEGEEGRIVWDLQSTLYLSVSQQKAHFITVEKVTISMHLF